MCVVIFSCLCLGRKSMPSCLSDQREGHRRDAGRQSDLLHFQSRIPVRHLNQLLSVNLFLESDQATEKMILLFAFCHRFFLLPYFYCNLKPKLIVVTEIIFPWVSKPTAIQQRIHT